MTSQRADGQKQTRRELLVGAGRCAALAGLAALVWLLGRRSGPSPASSSCVNDGLCRSCTELKRCILPAAQYTRRAEGRADG